MKTNQKGYSAVEAVVALVMVGLLMGIGWRLWHHRDTITHVQPPLIAQQEVQTAKPTEAEQSMTTAYSFEELGLTMDIPEGWTVRTDHTQQNGVKFYEWIVEKPGADGAVYLASEGLRGGFTPCVAGDTLTAATVYEVEPTQNADLYFMRWSYVSSDRTVHAIAGIAPADESIFHKASKATSLPITNRTTVPGTYYFCLTEPGPGFDLALNAEAAPGYTRVDHIGAGAAAGSTTIDGSYSELKAMLTSIR